MLSAVIQLLLRGAKLKNTKWIYGIAVYTGNDAKLLMNTATPPLKSYMFLSIYKFSFSSLYNEQTKMCLNNNLCMYNMFTENGKVSMFIARRFHDNFAQIFYLYFWLSVLKNYSFDNMKIFIFKKI